MSALTLLRTAIYHERARIACGLAPATAPSLEQLELAEAGYRLLDARAAFFAARKREAVTDNLRPYLIPRMRGERAA